MKLGDYINNQRSKGKHKKYALWFCLFSSAMNLTNTLQKLLEKRKQISEVLEIILSYLRLGLCRDGLHITRGKNTMLEAAL